jgi:hypothetical protein
MYQLPNIALVVDMPAMRLLRISNQFNDFVQVLFCDSFNSFLGLSVKRLSPEIFLLIQFFVFSKHILSLGPSLNAPHQHIYHRLMRVAFLFFSLFSFRLNSSPLSEHTTLLPDSLFPHLSQVSKLCSTYNHGLSLQRFLFSLFRSSHHAYHPLSVNKKENMICYVLISNSTISSQIQQLPSDHRIVFEEIPRLDRIHSQSIESFLSLFSDSEGENTDPFNHLSVRKRSSDLHQAKLLLTFGIGVMNKFHGLDSEELKLEKIRHRFLTRNPMKELREFTRHHLNDLANHQSKFRLKHVWNDALATFDHSPLKHSPAAIDNICSDSQISIQILPTHQIQLGNLQEYFSAQTTQETQDLQQACFLSLISHFISTYSLLIDLRVVFPKHTFNHLNKGIVQNNSYSEFYPYHEVGLDGSGQIIGLGKCLFYSFLLFSFSLRSLGDTGIDELSCFFRNFDASQVTRSSYLNPFSDLSKRKVIQYVSYGDSMDRSGGHGTHVAGTIAGSSTGIDSSNLKHGGHAPGAQIAFFDMEDSSHPEYGIVYPSPIGSYVFQAAYNAGARLHSNSWGSSFNFYDSDTISIDHFHIVYPDFLAIFAAGNDGAKGFYSLGNPAVSKNAIAVGATRSDSMNEIDRVAYFSSLGPTFDERIKVRESLCSSPPTCTCLISFRSLMWLLLDTPLPLQRLPHRQPNLVR